MLSYVNECWKLAESTQLNRGRTYLIWAEWCHDSYTLKDCSRLNLDTAIESVLTVSNWNKLVTMFRGQTNWSGRERNPTPILFARVLAYTHKQTNRPIVRSSSSWQSSRCGVLSWLGSELYWWQAGQLAPVLWGLYVSHLVKQTGTELSNQQQCSVDTVTRPACRSTPCYNHHCDPDTLIPHLAAPLSCWSYLYSCNIHKHFDR